MIDVHAGSPDSVQNLQIVVFLGRDLGDALVIYAAHSGIHLRIHGKGAVRLIHQPDIFSVGRSNIQLIADTSFIDVCYDPRSRLFYRKTRVRSSVVRLILSLEVGCRSGLLAYSYGLYDPVKRTMLPDLYKADLRQLNLSILDTNRAFLIVCRIALVKIFPRFKFWLANRFLFKKVLVRRIEM